MEDQDSEVTNDSDIESTNGNDGHTEVANILGQRFNLPKDLCDNHELFNELFSMSTWNQLLSQEKEHLSKFLPSFPDNQQKEEEDKTVEQLFNKTLSRFGRTPLDSFFNNLQDGNYRPDIAHYRKLILKAEERDQRIQECERISILSQKLVLSREKQLKSMYRRPTEGCKSRISTKSAPFSRLSSSMVRANRRFLLELRKISNDMDFELSDEESKNLQLEMKLQSNKVQPNEQRNENCEKETKIYSTLFKKQVNLEPPLDVVISNDMYVRSLKNYRKRKIIEPENSEMDLDEIKLKDVITRANFSKKIAIRKKSIEMAKNYLLVPKPPTTQYKNQVIKMPNKSNLKIAREEVQEKVASHSEETDEESWIKANIIKVEPSSQKPCYDKTTQGAKHKNVEMVINRKRPNFECIQNRAATKKIIIDKDGEILSQTSSHAMHDHDLSDNIGPELKHETQMSFLSLIRDMFCSTPDHRMKLEELRRRINVWLKNPVASSNSWYKDVSFWGNLLFSAVHFLSGEFLDQPEGFVPYLEFKSHLNIYQWIGAGRDNDSSMKNLNQYWLSRQEEMGIKTKQKAKTTITLVIPENNAENFLRHSISPPCARCKSNWKVRAASDQELNNFQAQERRRFENPFKSFTFHQHDYQSIVGPVLNQTITAAAKSRDNSLLKSERPAIVTTTNLVRDAIARLPNGEGTRTDICEMLKNSQHLLTHVLDKTLLSVIANVLDNLCSETDPCVKFDVERKLWIYLHRNRTSEEFEKLYQHLNEKKKPQGKAQQLKILTQTQAGKVAKVGFTSTFNKSIPCSSTMTQNQIQSSPPPLKIFSKKIMKPVVDKSIELFDAEASLEVQAIVKSADHANKTTRVTLKNTPQMTSFVQSQSPKVTTIIGPKKTITTTSNQFPLISKPVISGTNYLTNKLNTSDTSGMINKPTLVQNKTILKMNPNLSKTLGNTPQKIFLTTAANAQSKTGKLITFSQNQSPMLSQQKQILTNVIVQQQKAKSSQNHVLLAANKNQQSITIVSTSASTTTQASPSQVIIQQPSLIAASPQQRQAILQLKQLKDSTPAVIMKPTPTLVNISKISKPLMNATQLTQQPITSTSSQKFAQFAVVGKDKNLVSITSCQPTLVSSNVTCKTTPTQIASSMPSTSLKIVQGGSISAQQILNAKFINLQTLNNKSIKSTGGIKMLNTQGYSKLPIIITGNKNATHGQGMMLQLNPTSNGTFLLNSQGQQLKVQGNILTQGNANILTSQGVNTSQAQTVVLGNQVLKVQALNRLNSQVSTSTGNVILSTGMKSSFGGEGQLGSSSGMNLVPGSTLKILKNVVKTNNTQQPQQTAKVVLTSPGNQTTMQQIILPANFQGIKNLQGFKVIQQARILPSSTTTSINTSNISSNAPEGQQSTSIPKDTSKE